MDVDVDAVGWCDASSGSFEFAELTTDGPFPGPSDARHTTQVARCRVGDAVVLLVHALLPALGERERLTLANALSSEACLVVAFVSEAGAGRCRVDVVGGSPRDEVCARVAMAAAVVQASWAWDESERIVVTMGDRGVEVVPRHSSDGWCAEEYAP